MGARETARDFNELTESLDLFESVLQDTIKATRDETKAKKTGLGSLATGALAGARGLATQSAISSLSNPNLSFSSSLTDSALGALASFGIGNVQGRTAVNLAEQRTLGFAGRIGRGGRELSEERARARLNIETRRASLEVRNQDLVASLAAQGRTEATAQALDEFPRVVSALENVADSIKRLVTRLQSTGGR